MTVNKIKGFQDTIDWYNRHAKEFLDARKTGTRYDTMEEFEKLLPRVGKILDAGCGVGQDTDLFRQRGFDVTGLDYATGLIEEAKRNYPECSFLVGDMRSLPFATMQFDGVWAKASLLHFETKEDVVKSLKEFHRVLKDSSVLFVSVKLQTKEKMGLEEDLRFDEPRFFQYFTQEEMHELFKETGFEVVLSKVVQSKSRSNVVWIQIIGRKV